jgi:hypothetical protein
MPLEEAIKEQIEKTQLELDEKPEVEVEKEEAPETQSEDLEEESLEESELKEAANLYKLLKNKDTRNLVLKTLGEKAGLFDKPLETPKQVAKAERDIKTILSETLGKEYDFLIPKLGDALEKILEDVQEKQQHALGQVQQEQINSQVVNELTELARETKGASRGLEARMSALSQKFPPGEGLSVKEYIRGLHAMAQDGKPATAANKIAERINRNSKDVPSRLTSSTAALKDGSKALGKLTLDQSVKHALQQLGMGKE